MMFQSPFQLSPMFGVLFFERDPLGFQDIPRLFLSWVQIVGGYAAVLLVLYLIGRAILGRGEGRSPLEALGSSIAFYALCLAILSYLPLLALINEKFRKSPSGLKLLQWSLTIGGGLALLAVLLPFLQNVVRLRWRRIWALAKLSFKEGVRRRILYVFSALLIVLLFASWFIPYKPEDQVRTYVQVVDLAMTPLLLFAALLVAAFSIPTDIRQQSIHTVITKPVERFEIILGRFLGFTGLMTLVLVVMSLVSLIYVLRGVDPEAADQSLKARDPLYGVLSFRNTGNAEVGERVGREWDYRSYISGPMPGRRTPSAVWSFPVPSSSLAERDSVPCEFAFDIYRTTKGVENRGVSCAFVFRTWRYQPGDEANYRTAKTRLESGEQPGFDIEAPTEGRLSNEEINNVLAERFGYFEVPAVKIVDYRTLDFAVPGGLFRNAIPKDAKEERIVETQRKGTAYEVEVTCISSTQYVGMARYDFYFRLDDSEKGNDRLLFAVNFMKGSAGLWFRLCLVIGLAVALSTYLTGVISLLIAALLFAGGYAREFIEKVAEGSNIGGGPMESLYKIATRKAFAAVLEENASGTKVISYFDVSFRWLVRRVLEIIPDIQRFDLSPYVAEGFNIPVTQLLISSLLLFGYLFPWALLGFYLLRWREIASSS